MKEKKKEMSNKKLIVLSSLLIGSGYLSSAYFSQQETLASTTIKNIDANGENCEIMSGEIGTLENVLLDTPFAYSNEEIKKGQKQIYEVISNAKIEVITNRGRFVTNVPELKTPQEAKEWYTSNGQDKFDVGDVCLVPMASKNQVASDGYVVNITLPKGKSKLAKYDNGKYSFTKDFKNVKETVSENNTKLSITVPAQIVDKYDAKPNINITPLSTVTTIRAYKYSYKTGEALEGHVFTLYTKDKKKIISGKTNEDGYVDFYNVPIGDYIVKETKRPDDLNPKDINYKLTTDMSDVKKIVEITDRKAPTVSKPQDLNDKIEGGQYGESSDENASIEDYGNEDYPEDILNNLSEQDKCDLGIIDCSRPATKEELEELLQQDKDDELSQYYDDLFDKQIEKDNEEARKEAQEEQDALDKLKEDNAKPKPYTKDEFDSLDNLTPLDNTVDNQTNTDKPTIESDKEELPKTGSTSNPFSAVVGSMMVVLSTLFFRRKL